VSGFSRTVTYVRLIFCLRAGVLTGNPGHLKTFDYIGPYRYFLTFCTDSRQRVFVTRERVDLVLENPLRANLVQRVEDYPFSGSRVYSTPEILEAVSMIDIRQSG
jgi:hypothetical protein